MSDLILFGAGASFGSDDSSPVPPLSAGLFDALCAFDPVGWGAVDKEAASRFRTDFEQGMKAFADAHPSDGCVDALHRAMGEYFLQFHPSRASLYLRMAERIRRTKWNGSLVSLNYERLLKVALQENGLLPVHGRAMYYGEVELCVPHGCCNLFINLRIARGIVLGSPNIEVDSAIPPEQIDRSDEALKRIREDQVPPVMCYIHPDKQSRAGRSFINGQKERFATLVRGASTVGVIGARVRPADKHIWDPLRGTSARIVYCAGKEAEKEFESWSRNAGRCDDVPLASYWRDAFDEICSLVGIA